MSPVSHGGVRQGGRRRAQHLRPSRWLMDDDDAVDVVRHHDMGIQCSVGEMIGYSLPATISDLTEFESTILPSTIRPNLHSRFCTQMVTKYIPADA